MGSTPNRNIAFRTPERHSLRPSASESWKTQFALSSAGKVKTKRIPDKRKNERMSGTESSERLDDEPISPCKTRANPTPAYAAKYSQCFRLRTMVLQVK